MYILVGMDKEEENATNKPVCFAEIGGVVQGSTIITFE